MDVVTDRVRRYVDYRNPSRFVVVVDAAVSRVQHAMSNTEIAIVSDMEEDKVIVNALLPLQNVVYLIVNDNRVLSQMVINYKVSNVKIEKHGN